MMLNALAAYGLPAPTEAALSPFGYHTEKTMFTSACVRAVPTHLGGSQPLDGRFVAAHGATLQEWVRGALPGRVRRAAHADTPPLLPAAPAQAGYLSCYAKCAAHPPTTAPARR